MGVKRHQCEITESDIKHYQSNREVSGPHFYELKSTSHQEVLKIVHDISYCGSFRGNVPYLFSKCTYAIGLKGKPSVSHYL